MSEPTFPNVTELRQPTDDTPTEPDTRAAPGTEIEQVPDISRGVMAGVSVAAKLRYAKALADANLLPGNFRRQPGNILWAIEYGVMLGIHPMAAITGIHVQDGKPTASAALMSALVRRAGHKIAVRKSGSVETGDLSRTVIITRCDQPDEPFEATWTPDRAVRAELVDSYTPDERGVWQVISRTKNNNASNWQKYPENMCYARALSEAAREACQEALCGVQYTPEELGALVDGEGNVIDGEGNVIDGEAAWSDDEDQPAGPPPLDVDKLRAHVLAAKTIPMWEAVNRSYGERHAADPAAWHRLLAATATTDAEGKPCTALALLNTTRKAIAAASEQTAPGNPSSVPTTTAQAAPEANPAPAKNPGAPVNERQVDALVALFTRCEWGEQESQVNAASVLTGRELTSLADLTYAEGATLFHKLTEVSEGRDPAGTLDQLVNQAVPDDGDGY